MSLIQLTGCGPEESTAWPSWQFAHRDWLLPFVSTDTTKLIKNARTNFKLLRLDELILPVTVNDEEFDNSYVCSPYTAYVSYAKEELHKLRWPALIIPLRMLLSGVGCLMKFAEINRIVHCNNWLLSTNLYDEIRADLIPEMTKRLIGFYPRHFVLFRSLNTHGNAALLRALNDAEYTLIPSRQVYIFDRSKIDYLKRPNVKRDLKLLEKTNFSLVTHVEVTPADYPRIVELYNALYLVKHSYHNPQFTSEFIGICHSKKLMTMYGLRDAKGELQGIVGYFERRGTMTTPLVGYNTLLPQSYGLYRMLIALVLRDAAKMKVVLNLSSGASGFKRLRGGIPYIEYSAAYIRHLPLKRRMFIGALQVLLNWIGVPLMKAFKL